MLRFDTETSRLRSVALLEGISFVLLLFVAMPLKYLAEKPLAVTFVGAAHGALFVALAWLVLTGIRERGKSLRWGARIMIASILPFGTLVLDRRLREEDEAEARRNGRARPKRTQFWGKDLDDDSLVREILAGEKTATVCKADEYHRDLGELDDGGMAVGDVVEVYDLRKRLRCTIRVTEVYPVRFGEIPERLWRGEVCTSAEHFREAHRICWPDYDLSDDFEMIAMHFELVEVIEA